MLEPFASEPSFAFSAASFVMAASSRGTGRGSDVRSRGVGLLVWPKLPAPATSPAFSTFSFHFFAIVFSFGPLGDSSTTRASPGRAMEGRLPAVGTTTGPPMSFDAFGVKPWFQRKPPSAMRVVNCSPFTGPSTLPPDLQCT